MSNAIRGQLLEHVKWSYYPEQGILTVFPKQEFSLSFIQSSETRFIKTNPKQKILVFTSFPNDNLSLENRKKF